MRLQSLRQTANRYLKMDRRGSFKDRQHRAFVIQKMMNDLFIVGDVPASWRNLKPLHILKLVQHWQRLKIQPATIMRYMTAIRRFLNRIGCPVTDIDNHSLCLTREYGKKHKKTNIQSDIWKTMNDPSARLIMALQTQFGLTFSEAMRCVPDIHCREHSLWITREIAFNSEDRIIPVRNEIQKSIITDLAIHTSGTKSLMQQHGYDNIRYQWRQELVIHNLPTNKSYRYLYAQQLKTNLPPILGNYQICWLIRDEMGIKSRNTLWLYLNE